MGSVTERSVRVADRPVTIARKPLKRKKGLMRRRGLGKLQNNHACAVVLLGPPGSGKTTLARSLAKRRRISVVEIGNLLAREVRRETPLGRTLRPYTSAGNLAPLELVKEVVSSELEKARDEVVLFDGIPRSTAQIEPFFELLNDHRLDLCAVIILTLDLPTVLDRLSGRRVCGQCGSLYNVAARPPQPGKICEQCGGELMQREDDRREVVRERFRRFKRETVPVIKFFKKEFGPLTWEQSATLPQNQRVDRVWRRLEEAIRRIGRSRENSETNSGK